MNTLDSWAIVKVNRDQSEMFEGLSHWSDGASSAQIVQNWLGRDFVRVDMLFRTVVNPQPAASRSRSVRRPWRIQMGKLLAGLSRFDGSGLHTPLLEGGRTRTGGWLLLGAGISPTVLIRVHRGFITFDYKAILMASFKPIFNWCDAATLLISPWWTHDLHRIFLISWYY